MADIELTTVGTVTVDRTADKFPFIDVSPAPDETKYATVNAMIGQNLVDISVLADPNADRILFWDDSAGAFTWLTLGTNLSITATTINASGGGLSGLGSTDNAILRADGTGGATAQGSGAIVTDAGYVGATGAAAVGSGSAEVPSFIDAANPTNGVGLHGSGAISLIRAGAALAWDGVTLWGGSNNQYGFGGNANGPFGGGYDTALKKVIAKFVSPTDGSTGGGGFAFTEMTAPSAPAANGCYLYVEDNGSGKTRLMALFSSGAAQQVAIQP